jgi:hypothetical protein
MENIWLGLALILVPALFNWTFASLAKQFEYPDILRKPTEEVLAKFRAGGSKLVLTWWLFAMSAILFGVVAVFLPSYLDLDAGLLGLVVAFGLLAALTQFLGLVRWPFVIPHLAREAKGASPEKLSAIDVAFQVLNRYLGVAVGEHLGYLFTGLWTLTIGLGLTNLASVDSQVFQYSLAATGALLGALLVVCSFEFVGKNEQSGWAFAGRITPFVYIAWSLWLVSFGCAVLVGAL